MAQSERLQIELPADLATYVHGRVGHGALATASDVVREAVRALQESDAIDEELRRMIAEADADPRPPLTDTEVAQHFRAKWAARGDHA